MVNHNFAGFRAISYHFCLKYFVFLSGKIAQLLKAELVYQCIKGISVSACKTPTLRFGRVRSRQRGKSVKFLCNLGFQLAGERTAFCINGAWDVNIPKCVRKYFFNLKQNAAKCSNFKVLLRCFSRTESSTVYFVRKTFQN